METKRNNQSNNLVVQGSILALASLLVRLIGFFYRIPLVNLLGDEGMGYYSNSFVIYSFALTISAYGMPAAVSKLVSARMVQKKYKEAHRVFSSAFVIALIIGVITASILWFGATELANLMKSPRSYHSIQALAPALLIFSVMATFRGYFQGMNTMMPTAISQIVEQIFNAIFSIVMASILIQKGFEYGASGGTMGTGIGAFAGLITLIVIYYLSRSRINKRMHYDSHKNISTYFTLSKLVLMTSIPIVIGTAAFHLTNLVDMFMFQNALYFHGYSEKARVTLYGLLTGKYKLLVTLPISIASALATASIPSITASLVRNNHAEIKQKINLAIRFIMFIAMPSAFGLLVLSKPIVLMLFNSESLDTASTMLKMGTLSIIFFTLSTISIGILQGMNKLRVPVINSIIALIVKVLLNIVFLYIFDTNLYGAVITNILFAFTSAYLNLRAIIQFTKITLDVRRTFVIPFLSALMMSIICYITYLCLALVITSNTIVTLLSIGIAVIAYCILIISLKGITPTELSNMPMGGKILRVFKKAKLIK